MAFLTMLSGWTIPQAPAAVDLYTGGSNHSSTSWFAATNWSTGKTPATTDIAQFDNTYLGTTGVLALGTSSVNNGTGNEAVAAIDIASSRASVLTLSDSSINTQGKRI